MLRKYIYRFITSQAGVIWENLGWDELQWDVGSRITDFSLPELEGSEQLSQKISFKTLSKYSTKYKIFGSCMGFE